MKRTVIIIPGARKSGTTTLFEMLSKHSAIQVPRIKEPAFFAFEKEIVEQYIDAYENLFENCDGKILLDASTYYLMSQRTPRLIREYVSDPKIIIILRDPAKRAFSSFMHNCKQVPRPDKRSFDEILAKVCGPEEENIISTENEYLKDSLKRGSIDANYPNLASFGQPYQMNLQVRVEDKYWIYKYFQQSLYRRHLARFKEEFGQKMFIIFFEKLIQEPEKIMSELFDFLGLPPESQCFQVTHTNITRIPKTTIARSIQKLRAQNRQIKKLIEWFKTIQPTRVKAFAIRQFYNTPKITIDQYFRAREILQKEYAYWLHNYPELKKLWKF